MKFDKTKIGKILSDIERYERDLKKLKIKTPSELRKMEKILYFFYADFFIGK
jgi:hypothetical protein